MLGKIKKILGIEGVKADILLDDHIKLKDRKITGRLVFESLRDDTISKISFRVLESYTRGRFKGRKTDRYILQEEEVPVSVFIRGGERTFYDFTVSFNELKSEMDRVGESNAFYRGAVILAKTLKGVRSKYFLEVKLTVRGTALHPRAEKEVKFK